MSFITALRITGGLCVALLGQAAIDLPKAVPSLRQVAALHTARAAHTATTLSSGDVLIVGGMAVGGGSVARRFHQP